VTVEYAKLVERDESALFVSLISRGFEEAYFEAALGWEYEVVEHKYEACGHYISVDDRKRLRDVITTGLAERRDFWGDYIKRCNMAGEALLHTAERLRDRSNRMSSRSEVRDGFVEFAEATKTMVPFLAATVAVQAVLEGVLAESIANELPGDGSPDEVKALMSKLLVPEEEAHAVEEIRSVQQLALAAMDTDGAVDVIRGSTPEAAAHRLKSEHPELHEQLERHVEEFGWLRTHGYRFDPLSVAQLVERLRVILGRWNPEAIAAAGKPRAPLDVSQALGFEPSAGLGADIEVLGKLINLRFFRIDVHLQADCLARPFFAVVARELGCDREQLIFATVDEISAALAGESDLPTADIGQRIANSFVLTRHGDELEVRAYPTPLERAGQEVGSEAVLTGMAASAGRASGEAKIVFNPTEMHKVGYGDILVTTMTTPDLMLAIEKAAGIVTDEGGILSHAAIISRELGIPCVIGTERATRALRDGDVVDLDATQSTGRVQRVGQAPSSRLRA
jgi:phosphohistidine swiveling domain-containing protein